MNEPQVTNSAASSIAVPPSLASSLLADFLARVSPEAVWVALNNVSDRTGDTPDIRILRQAYLTLTFQQRVLDWVKLCFGSDNSENLQERSYRFFEEAAELVQSCGMTEQECHDLVTYAFSRLPGERAQELGGVMTTLAALCGALQLSMAECGERELSRIHSRIDKIRIKDANKPRGSSLPGPDPQEP